MSSRGHSVTILLFLFMLSLTGLVFDKSRTFQLSLKGVYDFVFSLSRSTRWTSREPSGSLCTTLCSITSTTHTSCVKTRWDLVVHVHACCARVCWCSVDFSLWRVIIWFELMMLIIVVKLCCIELFCLWSCPTDRVSAGAGRGPGAGGDGTEVSAERSLGRGALRSLWRAN